MSTVVVVDTGSMTKIVDAYIQLGQQMNAILFKHNATAGTTAPAATPAKKYKGGYRHKARMHLGKSYITATAASRKLGVHRVYLGMHDLPFVHLGTSRKWYNVEDVRTWARKGLKNGVSGSRRFALFAIALSGTK